MHNQIYSYGTRFSGVGTINVASTEAYVVTKGKNHSNIDADIHKVIPNKYEEIAEDARKKLSGYKRYDVRQRPHSARDNGLESLVLAINTGAKLNSPEIGRSNFMQKLENLLVDFLKDDRVNTFFRSRTDTYNVKPEIVHFRSGKPSLMVEVNFEHILRALRDALNSKKVKQYADKWAQKAALVYRAIKHELHKENRPKEYL
ncbi:unnamed protein product [Parnassius mnemosyne]|uniref:Uncharacterized protein n=1 Tax=Parnassius mnemosyne TaxID=213953 RepID=A0AAV1LDD1_9NEOP